MTAFTSNDSVSRKPRTKGELEAAISRAFIRLEKEFTGRGPVETHTYLLNDLVVVRLCGVMTPAEQNLLRANERGAYLIKQSRLELTQVKRPRIEEIVREFLNVGIRSLHTDICTETGERIVALSLDGRPTIPEE